MLMKKTILPILTFVCAMLCFVIARTQNGIISTVAGNGTAAYSGNGGPATAASLLYPNGITSDGLGSFYITDQGTIRKVSAAGIITQVAGNGSMAFSGDGGPAIGAGINVGFYYTGYVAADNFGNLYISDDNNWIRKVNASGIISTIAGNGT